MAAIPVLFDKGELIPDPASGASGGKVSFAPTVTMKVGGGTLITEDVMFSFSGGASAALKNIASVAPAKAMVTGIKMMANNLKPVREGDKIMLNCQGITPDGSDDHRGQVFLLDTPALPTKLYS
jgi:hypothetical protein